MIVIEIPLPPRELHTNSKPNRYAKSRKTASQRNSVALYARQFAPPQPFARATIDVTFRLVRTMDDDGLWHWLKATRDGLADAGFVKNDSHFRQGTMTILSGKKQTGGVLGVVLTIRDTSVADVEELR